MKKGKKADEMVKLYLRWPLLFIILFAVMAAAGWVFDSQTGIVMSFLSAFGILIAFYLYRTSGKPITKALVSFAMSAEGTQQHISQVMDIPCAFMDGKGDFYWQNEAFKALIAGDGMAARNIGSMFAEFNLSDVDKIEESADYHAAYKDRKFRIRILKADLDNIGTYAVCLEDETELLSLKKENDDRRFTVGLIYMDNYDEAMESVEEVRRSLLTALIDRKITQYIESMQGLVKKLEKDKFFFVIERRYLNQMQEDRFDILEQVKTVNVGNEMRITLSMGIGDGGDTYGENYEFARLAMDMALGRGGDQAIVKNHETIRYFGGKTQAVEKTTRVKARVKAHALRELMESKERLIIMGHKLLDIDSFGAAAGVWRIAMSMEKKANIVVSNINSSVKPMMDRFMGGEYPEDMFISEAQAMALMDENTILVAVDVNRPSITEAPALLEAAKTIVVLDHHRQSAEIIDHAVLSYVEPYASSACEMVAEIVQYIAEDIKIRTTEADAMYKRLWLSRSPA